MWMLNTGANSGNEHKVDKGERGGGGGGNLGKEKLGRKIKAPGPVPNGLANGGSLLSRKNRNLLYKKI